MHTHTKLNHLISRGLSINNGFKTFNFLPIIKLCRSRQKDKIYLILCMIHQISGNKLPPNDQVLLVMFHYKCQTSILQTNSQFGKFVFSAESKNTYKIFERLYFKLLEKKIVKWRKLFKKMQQDV